MHANRLMPNVYRKKLLAFTINQTFLQVIGLFFSIIASTGLSVSDGDARDWPCTFVQKSGIAVSWEQGIQLS